MSKENIDVRYVADLARLDLSDQETETFQGQLESIIGYINKLKDVDIEGIEPIALSTPVSHGLREDTSQSNLGQADLLQNAPDSTKGQIRVPKVVDA